MHSFRIIGGSCHRTARQTLRRRPGQHTFYTRTMAKREDTAREGAWRHFPSQRLDLRIAAPSLLVLLLTSMGPSTLPVSAHPGSQHRFSVQEERIAENPDDPVPYLNRARLWGQASHWSEALADLARAEERGGDPQAIALGRLDAWQTLQRWDEALVAADHALALDPELAGARRSRGLILGALGRHQAAARELARAFSSFENPAPALVVELAAALQQADRIEEARQQLDAALLRFGPRSLLLRSALSLELDSRGRTAAEQRLDELTGGTGELAHRLLWAETLAENGYPGAAREALSQLLLDARSTDERPPRGIERLRRRAQQTLQRLGPASDPATHPQPPHGKK